MLLYKRGVKVNHPTTQPFSPLDSQIFNHLVFTSHIISILLSFSLLGSLIFKQLYI